MTKKSLPYSRQTIFKDDIDSITEAIKDDFLTTGSAVSEFEKAFADRVNSKYAVSCTSGTAALHLSSMALNIKPNDFVAVPAISFLSTANAPRYMGAEVLFIDVDPNNGLISIEDLEKKILELRNKNISAVYPVHLNGQSVDMERLSDLSKKYGFNILEDACHALGTEYSSNEKNIINVGSCQHSDISIFSLHAIKTITTGEGGMITTNNSEYYQKILRARNHGIVQNNSNFINKKLSMSDDNLENPWYYEMHDLGFNYRLTDFQCALGISQLRKLDLFSKKRKELANFYDKLLEEYFPHIKPISKIDNCNPTLHLYAVLIDFESFNITRAYTMNYLKEKGITTQVHYIPINKQPYYTQRYGEIVLKGADNYYKRTLTLPLFPLMNNDDVKYIVNSLRECLKL